MTIAHTLIKAAAADHEALVNFYRRTLKPLGTPELTTMPNGWVIFGNKAPEWVVGVGEPNKVHVAFAAPDRAAVDTFHKEALAAGGKDNGAPGPRASIHPNYYAAFVLDPVGNNIEAGFMGTDEAK